MQADGTVQARVTQHEAVDFGPAWSPDSRRIVFQSDRDGDMNIYVMDADGSNVTHLTEDPANDERATWSPDGRHILFASDREGNSEIYVMDADGGGVKNLTNHAANDVLPTWSPDGSQIAFSSDRDGNLEIYVINSNGIGARRLTKHPARDLAMDWSPPEVALSDEPGFGPPFCARDTDGDGSWDTPTNAFTTDDFLAYVVFPFHNMENGMEWTHAWLQPGNLLSPSFLTFWDGGESGIHIAASAAPTVGAGPLTIELLIADELVQEIRCDVMEP